MPPNADDVARGSWLVSIWGRLDTPHDFARAEVHHVQ